MAIDRARFFDHVRTSGVAGRPLKPTSVESLEAILDAWRDHFPKAILDEIAYTMATARHEAWAYKASQQYIDYAIEEGGGASRPYGQPHKKTGKRYYGRGLTQLTHYENYDRAGKYFHTDLLSAPELALRKDISAGVLVVGSVLGWFRKGSRGTRIGYYFNAKVNDPIGARGIINGDVAKNGAAVAGYHHKFLAALKAAEVPDIVPVPKPPAPPPRPPVEPMPEPQVADKPVPREPPPLPPSQFAKDIEILLDWIGSWFRST
jgi:putative chitinase